MTADYSILRQIKDPELRPKIIPADASAAFACTASDLQGALDRIVSVAQQKEQIPGTSLVTVVVMDNGVTLMASDGAQTAVVRVASGESLRNGKIFLPAHRLRSVVQAAPEPEVVVSSFNLRTTVSSGRAIWTIDEPERGRAPAIPSLAGVEYVDVPRKPFLKALSRVSSALPGAGARKSLEQVKVGNSALSCSDGYRLLRQKVEALPEALTFGIPKPSVPEVIKALTVDDADSFRIGVGDSVVVFRTTKETLIVRENALDYPDIEKILLSPALQNDTVFVIDSVELKEVIKRVRILADAEYDTIALDFSKTEDSWYLTVVGKDSTSHSGASETLGVMSESTLDKGIRLVVNHRYMLDMVNIISPGLMSLKVSSMGNKKALPLLVDDAEKGVTAVIQQSYSKIYQ